MFSDDTVEKQVLSHIIRNNDIPINIRDIDFASSNNLNIYKVIVRVVESKSALTPHIISSYFPQEVRKGLIDYIEKFEVTSVEVTGLIAHLRNLTEKRFIDNAIEEAKIALKSPELGVQEVLNKLDDSIAKAPVASNIRNQIISPEDYEKTRSKQIENKVNNNFPFVGTGLDTLDNDLADGFRTGQISVIAGITSHGKSVLLQQAAIHVASSFGLYGIDVLAFSPESGNEKLSDRIDVNLTNISIKELNSMNRWEKNDKRFEKLKQSAKKQASWRLHRFDNRGMSATDLLRVCKDYKRLYPNLRLIFVDTVQDLSDNIGWDSNSTQNNSLERMLYKFEKGAQELDLHICLVSQLQKVNNDKKRNGFRPSSTLLRGTAAYEQKAATILFVYRPFIDMGGDSDNEIYIWLVKNRDGVRMKWYKYVFEGKKFGIGEYLESGF